jgi:hypothetical protein
MWLTIAIAGGLFAGMVAILWFGYQQMEEQRQHESDAVLANAPAARPGHCMLCDAPLRRAATTDEVLFEVEHRIDAEREEIVRALWTQPDGIQRLYRA